MLEHVVHEMLEHIQPVVWVIAREQINFTEDLERVDDGQDRDEQDGRGEIAQLDVEEDIAARRAVQLRRLDQLLRDIVERGHEQNHVIAEVFPEEQADDDDHAVVGFQPVDLVRAENHEEFIDDAV